MSIISEYDITFAVKEWLLRHNWDVVAFNPPGAQGTFTIPNPAKDPLYRGQTGSQAPDIIAVKSKNLIIVVESKPKFNQVDIDKLTNLSKNRERIDLMVQLIESVCHSNNVPFEKPCDIILATAQGVGYSHAEKVAVFQVSVKEGWNPESIDPKIDPYEFMEVTFKSTDPNSSKIIADA